MKLKETFVLGVSIIAGCFVLGLMLSSSLNNLSTEISLISNKIAEQKIEDSTKNPYRYELISPNDSNILIFDSMTGEYWRKYIDPNSGPTDWKKEIAPDLFED